MTRSDPFDPDAFLAELDGIGLQSTKEPEEDEPFNPDSFLKELDGIQAAQTPASPASNLGKIRYSAELTDLNPARELQSLERTLANYADRIGAEGQGAIWEENLGAQERDIIRSVIGDAKYSGQADTNLLTRLLGARPAEDTQASNLLDQSKAVTRDGPIADSPVFAALERYKQLKQTVSADQLKDAEAVNWQKNDRSYAELSSGSIVLRPEAFNSKDAFDGAVNAARKDGVLDDREVSSLMAKWPEIEAGFNEAGLKAALPTQNFQDFKNQPDNQGLSDEAIFLKYKNSQTWVDQLKYSGGVLAKSAVDSVLYPVLGAAIPSLNKIGEETGIESLRQAGQALSEFAVNSLTNPSYSDDTRGGFGGGVDAALQAFGQGAGQVLMALTTRKIFGSRLAGTGTVMLSGSLQTGLEGYLGVYETAIASGKTHEQANAEATSSFVANMPPGLLEAVPIDKVLAKIPRGMTGKVVKAIGSGLAEVATENIQNYANNLVNQAVSSTYMQQQGMGLEENVGMFAGMTALDVITGSVRGRISRNSFTRTMRPDSTVLAPEERSERNKLVDYIATDLSQSIDEYRSAYGDDVSQDNIRKLFANAPGMSNPNVANPAVDAFERILKADAKSKAEADLRTAAEKAAAADSPLVAETLNKAADKTKSEADSLLTAADILEDLEGDEDGDTDTGSQGDSAATGVISQEQGDKPADEPAPAPAAETPAPARTLRESVVATGIADDAADAYIEDLRAQGISDEQILEIAENTRALREEAVKKNEAEAEARRDVARRARAGDPEARAQLERERGINVTPVAEPATPPATPTPEPAAETQFVDLGGPPPQFQGGTNQLAGPQETPALLAPEPTSTQQPTTPEGGDTTNEEEMQRRTETLNTAPQPQPPIPGAEGLGDGATPPPAETPAPAPVVQSLRANRQASVATLREEKLAEGLSEEEATQAAESEADMTDPESLLSDQPATEVLGLFRNLGSTLAAEPAQEGETFGDYLARTGVSVYDFDTRPTVFNESDRVYTPVGTDPLQAVSDLAAGRMELADAQLPPAPDAVPQTTPEAEARQRQAQQTEEFYRRNQQSQQTDETETNPEDERTKARETAKLTAEAPVMESGAEGVVSRKRLPVREVPTGRTDESGTPITKVVPGFVNDSDTMAEVLHQNRGVEKIYVSESEIGNLDPEDIFVEYDETGQAFVVAARHKKYGVIYANTGLTEDGVSLDELHAPTRLKNSQAQTEGKAAKRKAKKAGVSEQEVLIPEMTDDFAARVARAPLSKEEREKPDSVAKVLQQIYKKAQALASETVKTVTGETVAIGAELADRIATAASNLYLARIRGVDRKGKFTDAAGVVGDIKKKVIPKLKKRPGTRAGFSLDQAVGDGDATMGDIVGQNDPSLDSMGYADVPLDADLQTQGERGLEDLSGNAPTPTQDSNVQAAQTDRPAGISEDVSQRLGGMNYEEVAKNALAAAEAELSPADLKIWRETLPMISGGKKRADLTPSRKRVVKQVQASAKEKMRTMIAESTYEVDPDQASSVLSAAESRAPQDLTAQERKVVASAQVEQIIDWNGGPLAGKFDTKRILASIAEDSKQPQIVRVIARFLANSKVDFSNVTFEPSASLQKELDWAGLYTAGNTASSGKIQINVGVRHRGSVAQTIVHEALHHVAFHKLRPSYNRTGVEKEAYRDLVKILTHVRRQLLEPEPGQTLSQAARNAFRQDDDFYGVSNLDELFTETLTNTRFAAWLSSQPAIPEIKPKNAGVFRNLYEQVKQILKNLIGGQNVRPDSLLSQAMDNIMALAQDPQSDAKIAEYLSADKQEARKRIASSMGADPDDLDLPEGPGWLSGGNEFIPADESSSVRVSGVTIGGHERAALDWLEKNRPQTYERLYQESEGNPTSLSYGVITSAMEKHGFLRITGDSSTLYFTGRPTAKQVKYLKDVGMLLDMEIIHDLGDRSRTIFDPSQGAFSAASAPASRAQRNRMIKNAGGWKASGWFGQGLMDMRVFNRMAQKDAEVRGANFRVNETARVFNRLVKKHNPDAQILRDALGTTDNKLTDAQFDQWNKMKKAAQRETDPTKRQAALAAADSYRIGEVQKNNAQFRAARMAALNQLPAELRGTVNEMRRHIDSLSREMINKGMVGSNLQATLGDNLEVYLNRSYEIFDNPEWADFVKEDQSPEAAMIRNDAQRVLRSQLVAEEARRIRRNARLNNQTVPTRQQALAAAQATVTQNDVSILMEEYLRVGDDATVALLGGKLPGKKDTSILKLRGQIPAEIRALWGEYKDPGVNYAKTYIKMANFISNHNFQTDFLDMGMNQGTPFLWKDGVSQGQRPAHWVELYPGLKDSPNPNPLAGVYGPPIIVEAFKDINQSFKHSLVNDWMAGLTGMAMASKIIYNPPQTYVRNILGNGLIMFSQGYLFRDINKLGFLSRMVDSGKVIGPTMVGFRPTRSPQVVDYVERLISLGVMGDNVKANVIKNLTSVIFDRDPQKAFNSTLATAFDFAKSGNERLTDAYQAGDDFWKILAFESERATFAEAYPNATPEALDRMAADRVRDVVPTYSKIPKIVQDVVKKQPFTAPYISWTSEILRTFLNTARHGWKDATSGNPTLQKSGVIRLGSLAAAQGMLGAVAYFVRELSGLSEEDEERLKRFLPEWQVNALVMLTGRREAGKISFWDLSYLNPYDVLHEPFIAMGRAAKAGEDVLSIAAKGLEKFADPWTSEQLFFGALMDVARGVTADGIPLYEPADSTWNKNKARLGRIVDSMTPGTFNLGRRMYMAITGQISKGGQSYDLTNEFFAAFAGQRPGERDTLQAFQYNKLPAMQRMLDSANNLSTKEYRTRGTPDTAKIRENYIQSNDARFEAFKEVYKDIEALEGLGVPREKIFLAMKAAKIAEQDIQQIAEGIYVRRDPSKAAIENAVGLPEFPNRLKVMQDAVRAYPEKQSLAP